ncbi:MAG TPA: ATP-binding protein [Prolixibacteraceae bacterium]|nr:ATP-binding protein [Prolixibacteraceae bacterium]
MYIKRNITEHLKKMASQFPVISLTGPRQSGKTTLLKNEFQSYKYFNLERVDYREMIMEDPVGFLKQTGPNVIIDEAQKLPELFSYIQVISDERNLPGQYILSGSQSFLLSERISQSLAGRVNINHLYPFDLLEVGRAKIDKPASFILNGFYPRLHEQNISAGDFYPSYLQTYIERDIRTLKNIGDLQAFTRFLGLCAGRIGQPVNLSSLANDAGISVNTAKSWVSLLESSFIIYLLQPFYKNFNKRMIKAPKLFFYDTGVAASLLRITDIDMLFNHYLYGSLFENLIISEIIKTQVHKGNKPSVWYWRESNGVEIDCIIEIGGKSIALEIKSGQTFTSEYLKNLKKFANSEQQKEFEKKVIYAGDKTGMMGDIELFNWEQFPDFLKKL